MPTASEKSGQGADSRAGGRLQGRGQAPGQGAGSRAGGRLQGRGQDPGQGTLEEVSSLCDLPNRLNYL